MPGPSQTAAPLPAGIPRRGALGALAALGLATRAAAATRDAPAGRVKTEEFRLPWSEPGVEIYVRNKHAVGQDRFPGDRIVLYVHGSTYPASTAFDLALGGMSAMDYFVAQGFDVYLVDLPGYGFSGRPAQMSAPAADNPPFMRTPDAAKVVAQAVDFILARRQVKKINLMGWSWGTSTMGLYTSTHNDKVDRLVLYAPQWLARTPSLTGGGSGPIPAYRSVGRDSAKERWLSGVAADKRDDLIPPGWFDLWADATFPTDAVGAKQTPPVLRAPNGTLADSADYWRAGKPLYDPGDIRVPTLIIHAEWDADLPSYQAQEYFAKLTNVPYKRFVELGEGTHSVMMEKNRMQFLHAVSAFLTEADPQALN